MRRVVAFAGSLLLGLLATGSGIWGALAVLFSGPGAPVARAALSAAVVAVTLAALFALALRRNRAVAIGTHGVLFAALLVWYAGMAPSNDRAWQADVALLPHASIDGDIVTLHNIRNFAYRSETDYTPAWYDRSYDLRQLEGVDLIAAYWMGPAIAHTFLSFAFADGEHVAVSIETRKEEGEAYSALKGFFRQYELFYVVADERDVIRLRTNYRRDPVEDVYVYRAAGTQAAMRALFLEYLTRINLLRAHPEFYNSLTTNCTTNVWLNSRVNPGHLPFSWKIVASGYAPELMYEHGRLVTAGLSFPELQRRVHVNARAIAAGDAADFSRRIRMPATGPNTKPGVLAAPRFRVNLSRRRNRTGRLRSAR